MKSIFAIIILINGVVFGSIKWHTNLEKANKTAQETKQNILLVFSGSDWCKPCIQLKEDVFETTIFKEKISSNHVLVNIDIKRDQKNISKEEVKYRETIFEKYNPNGFFPYVVILSPNNKVLKTIEGYKGESPENYIELIN